MEPRGNGSLIALKCSGQFVNKYFYFALSSSEKSENFHPISITNLKTLAFLKSTRIPRIRLFSEFEDAYIFRTLPVRIPSISFLNYVSFQVQSIMEQHLCVRLGNHLEASGSNPVRAMGTMSIENTRFICGLLSHEGLLLCSLSLTFSHIYFLYHSPQQMPQFPLFPGSL